MKFVSMPMFAHVALTQDFVKMVSTVQQTSEDLDAYEKS